MKDAHLCLFGFQKCSMKINVLDKFIQLSFQTVFLKENGQCGQGIDVYDVSRGGENGKSKETPVN